MSKALLRWAFIFLSLSGCQWPSFSNQGVTSKTQPIMNLADSGATTPQSSGFSVYRAEVEPLLVTGNCLACHASSQVFPLSASDSQKNYTAVNRYLNRLNPTASLLITMAFSTHCGTICKPGDRTVWNEALSKWVLAELAPTSSPTPEASGGTSTTLVKTREAPVNFLYVRDVITSSLYAVEGSGEYLQFDSVLVADRKQVSLYEQTKLNPTYTERRVRDHLGSGASEDHLAYIHKLCERGVAFLSLPRTDLRTEALELFERLHARPPSQKELGLIENWILLESKNGVLSAKKAVFLALCISPTWWNLNP